MTARPSAPRLPSGSKLHLAFICPASAVLPHHAHTSGAGTSGTWKHRFVELARGGAFAQALEAVPEEYRTACAAIPESLFETLAGWGAELALAYDVETRQARIIGRGIEREYGPVAPTEMVLSLDYDALDGDTVRLADLKTGRSHVPPPERNWQLRLGALALSRVHGVDRAEAWLAFAREGDDEPRWVSATWDAVDLASFAEELEQLHRRIQGARAALERGETPRLTVGEQCRYCPARVSCPAQAALVKRMAGQPEEVVKDLKALVTAETAGIAWQRLKAAKLVLRDVEAALYAFAAETPVDLGDGRVLRMAETRRETLDGGAVYNAVKALHGEEIAWKTVELTASKAALERALRELPGPTAPKVRAVLEGVRLAGGATVKVTSGVKEVEQ